MISVVIPVFNAAPYVAQAIDSVFSQTLPPDEIVVVDDGSTDATADVVRRYHPRVAYFYQPNQGPGAARNLGIRESKGDLLAFLDADDLWLPEKLLSQKAALDADLSIDLVFCHMSQFREDEPEKAVEIAGQSVQPSPLISCMLARRTVFDRIGPLRTDLKAEFVEWYLRAGEADVRMRTLDDLLVKRRLHSANFTLANQDLRREYVHLLKASLDRRRAKAAVNPCPGTLQ
jgi:glycosyltransferase involved in cell wall biosynthesis